MGLRAHDHQAMPLCHKCHMEFHAASGVFREWDKAKRGEFQDQQIAIHRNLYKTRVDCVI